MTSITLARTHGHSIRDIRVWSGAVAGIVASLVMGAVAMLTTLIQGQGFFLVPKLIATLVLTKAQAASAFGIIVGLGIHLVLGIIYGLFFAILYTFVTERYNLNSALLLGAIYGLALWVVNFGVIGPLIGSEFTAQLAAGTAVPLHLIFGLALGLYPRFVELEE